METWFRLPMLVRVATIVLGWFGYALLVLSLNTPESADRIAMFVGIACVMGASVTAGVDQILQTTFGSIERLKAYRLALRTGDLQQGNELHEWRRWLRGSDLSNATAALAVGPFVVFGWMSSAYSQSASRTAGCPSRRSVCLWYAALSPSVGEVRGSSDSRLKSSDTEIRSIGPRANRKRRQWPHVRKGRSNHRWRSV